MDNITRLALAYFLILPTLGLVTAAVRVLTLPRPLDSGRFVESLMKIYLLFCIALTFSCNFVAHAFFGSLAAPLIGWRPSPFEVEVGTASLGFAMIGFYAIHRPTSVRFAAIIGPAAFLWGAAVGHVNQIVHNGNFSPGNAGFILYLDIFLPLIGFGLVWLSARTSPLHQADRRQPPLYPREPHSADDGQGATGDPWAGWD